MSEFFDESLYVGNILGTPINPDLPVYVPPEGLTDLMDRREGNKKFLLYIGEVAFLDIIIVGTDDEPLALLTRINDTPDQAIDLFQFPQRHADEEVSRNIFDREWLTEEEIDQIVGLRKAA